MKAFRTIFIPVVSNYAPPEKSIEEGLTFLGGIYSDKYSVEIKLHTNPCCVNGGIHFDRFFCPACQALVTKYDYSDWWFQSALANPVDQHQIVKTPCCGIEVQLKQFDFGHHLGFARFQIHVRGADENMAPNEYQLHQLESLLGCCLKRIIQLMET